MSANNEFVDGLSSASRCPYSNGTLVPGDCPETKAIGTKRPWQQDQSARIISVTTKEAEHAKANFVLRLRDHLLRDLFRNLSVRDRVYRELRCAKNVRWRSERASRNRSGDQRGALDAVCVATQHHGA